MLESRSGIDKADKNPTDAKCVGYIEIDMTDHKEAITKETNGFKYSRAKKSKRWNKVIIFDLVVIVEGRQLKFEARWPSGVQSPEEVKVRKTGYVSLAPSLAPGAA
jgi:hypothetical protein